MPPRKLFGLCDIAAAMKRLAASVRALRYPRATNGSRMVRHASVNLEIGEDASQGDEVGSFHKRELPSNLISLSSEQGKKIFKEALDEGGMQSYFPLSEQFLTQSEPAFCALSSLAMVLNALNHDPGKVWKGVWRWTSEETLRCDSTEICGHAFEDFKVKGVNFSEFESLATCHGIQMLSYRVGDDKNHARSQEHDRLCGKHDPHDCQHDYGHTLANTEWKESQDADAADKNMTPQAKFRSFIDQSCRSDQGDLFIIANFDRQTLGQTGSGHFSPIGGYHRQKDLVLIMDVARFKYPPWWVPVEDLWRAMAIGDPMTEESRGYFVTRN